MSAEQNTVAVVGDVEFDRAYDLPGLDVDAALIDALVLPERHLVLV